MSTESKWAKVARDFEANPPKDFVEAALRAGLDPANDLRYAYLEGVDFRGCNLGWAPGFDFRGARLTHCQFYQSILKYAHFEQAIIDEARPHSRLSINRTRIKQSIDWATYSRQWKRFDKPLLDIHFRAGDVFQDAPFGPEMVIVPAGSAVIGRSRQPELRLQSPPIKRRYFSASMAVAQTYLQRQPFAVSRFGVTVEEWNFYRSAKGLPTIKQRKGSLPATRVSFIEAKDYARWLWWKTGKRYRLLTESEWEYCFSADFSAIPRMANIDASYAAPDEIDRVAEVDRNPCSLFGLFDSVGNVHCWCEHSHELRSHFGPTMGAICGSSWVNRLYSGEISLRFTYSGTKSPLIGFRVCRDLDLSED